MDLFLTDQSAESFTKPWVCPNHQTIGVFTFGQKCVPIIVFLCFVVVVCCFIFLFWFGLVFSFVLLEAINFYCNIWFNLTEFFNQRKILLCSSSGSSLFCLNNFSLHYFVWKISLCKVFIVKLIFSSETLKNWLAIDVNTINN